jgi:ligand-binding sensor domain-containing protein
MLFNPSIFILLYYLLCLSCAEVSNKTAVPAASAPAAIETTQTTSTLNFNAFKTAQPIDQVVRVVFQDSKGSFWFGAEGGAFKLVDDTLTPVTGLLSEAGHGVTIKDIAEDPNGTLWFAHTGGLSSLKGTTLTNYYQSNGLPSNDVWCVTADRHGQIWVGTIAGVVVLNNNSFTKFALPDGKIDPSVGVSSTQMVHDILEDSTGTIWISTNAGLFSFAQGKLSHVSEALGIPTNFMNTLVEDSKGGLWVGTKVGLYHVGQQSAQHITTDNIEIGKGIGAMGLDAQGKLWVVVNQHELYSYNGTDFTKFNKTDYNRGPAVFQIYQDQAKRLWMVGFGGAYRLENGLFVEVTTEGPW